MNKDHEHAGRWFLRARCFVCAWTADKNDSFDGVLGIVGAAQSHTNIFGHAVQLFGHTDCLQCVEEQIAAGRES